jgi:hypothetical protein
VSIKLALDALMKGLDHGPVLQGAFLCPGTLHEEYNNQDEVKRHDDKQGRGHRNILTTEHTAIIKANIVSTIMQVDKE